MTGRLHGIEFVGVEEIAFAALMAEKQPVAPRRPSRPPVVQEGAEWCHTGAGADHDDGRLWILRQPEPMRLLNVDLERVARIDALCKKRGGNANALALADHVTNGIDRQRQTAGRRVV